MSKNKLDLEFSVAVEIASKMTQVALPQDTQLRLYAFYKQATQGSMQYNHSESSDLKTAFKTNAWFQVSQLSIYEAKEEYIKLLNSLL